MATEPEPAPMSQTTAPGWMASCARARARTSAWVIRPLLGRLWAEKSSGLPKRRKRARWAGPAGDVGQHLEGFLAQPVAQVAGHAVEQGVAARDDGDPLLSHQRRQLRRRLVEVVLQHAPLRLQLRQELEHRLRAEHHLRPEED